MRPGYPGKPVANPICDTEEQVDGAWNRGKGIRSTSLIKTNGPGRSAGSTIYPFSVRKVHSLSNEGDTAIQFEAICPRRIPIVRELQKHEGHLFHR